MNPTPIAGIAYYIPPENALLDVREGKAYISYNGTPVPLEEDDFKALGGAPPDYDMVGRGVYLALRVNPDCAYNSIYVEWIRDAYPQYITDVASMILMLDQKDVEVMYLDRKINYLKIMSLLEPANGHFPAEIGRAYLERGLRISALDQSTVSFYRAERFLQKANEINPSDTLVRSGLGEVGYLLGHYENVSKIWSRLIPELKEDAAERLKNRLQNLSAGNIPRVPPVDYLEAVSVAFDCYQKEEYDEGASILKDVLDDPVFCREFSFPEIWYYLALCYQNLALPKYAEECFLEAINRNPEYTEAKEALDKIKHRSGDL